MGIYRKQAAYFREAYRRGEHGWPVEGPDPFIARMVRAHRRPGGRALDLGCGEGRHAFLAAANGYRVIGVDYEPLAIRRARRLAASHPKAAGRVRFQVADLFKLPFRSGAFDLIIDYGCLHHVTREDTARYRAAVLSRLKPGGYFLLSCFSTKFKHHPRERRTRNWLVHRGHYDRFFRRDDFAAIFGAECRILDIQEERNGLQGFFHVAMQKLDGRRAHA